MQKERNKDEMKLGQKWKVNGIGNGMEGKWNWNGNGVGMELEWKQNEVEWKGDVYEMKMEVG